MFTTWLRTRRNTNSAKGRLIKEALTRPNPQAWVQLVIDMDAEFEADIGRKAAIRLMWEYRQAHGEDQTAAEPSQIEQTVPLTASTYLNVLKSLGLPL